MAMGTQIRMYEKKGDERPKHRIELPIFSLPAVEKFAGKYNIPQVPLVPGYVDFTREITKDDVRLWISDGAISANYPELQLWLEGKTEYGYVDILCYEWYYE